MADRAIVPGLGSSIAAFFWDFGGSGRVERMLGRANSATRAEIRRHARSRGFLVSGCAQPASAFTLARVPDRARFAGQSELADHGWSELARGSARCELFSTCGSHLACRATGATRRLCDSGPPGASLDSDRPRRSGRRSACSRRSRRVRHGTRGGSGAERGGDLRLRPGDRSQRWAMLRSGVHDPGCGWRRRARSRDSFGVGRGPNFQRRAGSQRRRARSSTPHDFEPTRDP